MTPNSDGKTYPYSRNRVLINGIVGALSIILALTLLWIDAVWLLSYLASTSVFTIITLYLKRYLYPRVLAADSQDESSDEEKKQSFWKVLVTTFLILLGFIAAPLLLAGLLTGPIWFVMMVSFTTGISISEIIFYAQARRYG